MIKQALIDAVEYLEKCGHEIPLALMVSLVSLGVKTVEYFQSTLTRMVRNVYDGDLGGEFVQIMQDLVLGQISQAFETAWTDDGNELPPPEYIRDASQEMVREQWSHIDDFYRAIVDARVDQTGVDPLLSRVQLWANRYNEAYNEGVRLIALETGGKLVWRLGKTEEHCDTCSRLNGIVAYASEWETAQVKPQAAPNEYLTCGGWRCDCSLDPTKKRKTPGALDKILGIIVGGHL